jgi:hypothetical protein
VALLVAVYSGLAIPAGGILAADAFRLGEVAGLLASRSQELLTLAAGLFTGMPGALFLISTWLVLLATYFSELLLLTAGRRTDEANVLELGSAP